MSKGQAKAAPEAQEFLGWLRRHSDRPDFLSQRTLQLFARGELDSDEMAFMRERIRQSPRAIQDYATLAGLSLLEAHKALDPEPQIIRILEGLAAAAMATIRQIALPTQSFEVVRDPDDEESTEESEVFSVSAEVPGDELSAATVTLSSTKADRTHYRVVGTITIDAAGASTQGHFLLYANPDPHGEPTLGDEIKSGAFDLGDLQKGNYRLELIVESRLIEINAVKIRD